MRVHWIQMYIFPFLRSQGGQGGSRVLPQKMKNTKSMQDKWYWCTNMHRGSQYCLLLILIRFKCQLLIKLSNSLKFTNWDKLATASLFIDISLDSMLQWEEKARNCKTDFTYFDTHERLRPFFWYLRNLCWWLMALDSLVATVEVLRLRWETWLG